MQLIFLLLSSVAEASTVRSFTLVVHAQEVETVHTETGEAVSRLGILVNGTYPGPTLTVDKGDQVHVTVVNQLADQETVLHFHGQHQVNTFYMDGVAGVTQVCQQGSILLQIESFADEESRPRFKYCL